MQGSYCFTLSWLQIVSKIDQLMLSEIQRHLWYFWFLKIYKCYKTTLWINKDVALFAKWAASFHWYIFRAVSFHCPNDIKTVTYFIHKLTSIASFLGRRVAVLLVSGSLFQWELFQCHKMSDGGGNYFWEYSNVQVDGLYKFTMQTLLKPWTSNYVFVLRQKRNQTKIFAQQPNNLQMFKHDSCNNWSRAKSRWDI